MSDTMASLGRKIDSAGDLQAVVRTMKAMAASSIGQYENAVRSLDEYYRTVQLGLSACFRQAAPFTTATAGRQRDCGAIGAIVFGSDQGLVGQFNDVMADFVLTTLAPLPGKKTVWAIGERIRSRFDGTELLAQNSFVLPNSIGAIAPLVGELLIETETERERGRIAQVYLFHNRPMAGSLYTPVCQRLLPLDQAWRRELVAVAWPSKNLPELMNHKEETMLAFVREYLFVSLFRACAESLSSENASRLAAMQRAEKNIEELLQEAKRTFHRLRQGGIDEELFDVVAGFESLLGAEHQARR